MEQLIVTGILAAGIRLGMAIGLSAIGEAASERSGVFNIGIEGIMLSAAFVAAWGSVRTGSPWLGIAFAMLIGFLLAGFHAMMVLVLGVNQFISGIGMVIFGLGFSSFAARLTIGAKPISISGLPPVDLGPLSHIPVIGPIFFGQSPLAYIALALALATGLVINRTALGLESALAARVLRWRTRSPFRSRRAKLLAFFSAALLPALAARISPSCKSTPSSKAWWPAVDFSPSPA